MGKHTQFPNQSGTINDADGHNTAAEAGGEARFRLLRRYRGCEAHVAYRTQVHSTGQANSPIDGEPRQRAGSASSASTMNLEGAGPPIRPFRVASEYIYS